MTRVVDTVLGLVVGVLSAFITIAVSVTILFGLGGFVSLVVVLPCLWRVARDGRRLTLSAGVFAVAYVATFGAAVVPEHVSCHPPECVSESWGFDLLAAISGLFPIAVATGLTYVLLAHRPSGAESED